MEFTTIAVDPGKHSGIACLQGDRLVCAMAVTCENNDPFARSKALETCLGMAKTSAACVTFVCEAQFFRANPRGQRKRGEVFKAATGPAESATAWETIARLQGCQVIDRVPHQTWRSTFGLAGLRDGDVDRAAVQVASERFAELPRNRAGNVSHDVASAVLLGLHVHVHRYFDAGLDVPPGLGQFQTARRRRRVR